MSGSSTDPETGLTPKQEAFCLELVRTGNASEAYRKAYNAGKMKPETVTRRASELANSGKVAARLGSLRSEVRRTNGISLSDHLTVLQELRQEARAVGQLAAAITAEVSRGKVSGLYNEADPDSDKAPITRVDVRILDARRV